MPKRLGWSSERVLALHTREGRSPMLGETASRVSGVHDA